MTTNLFTMMGNSTRNLNGQRFNSLHSRKHDLWQTVSKELVEVNVNLQTKLSAWKWISMFQIDNLPASCIAL